ncbi:4-phosphopantetheinyl transferase [Bifidobacterium goeldii]|uniref:Holo-[acyl-carrier-protein] synthase n=1 Tax=Bifidobacterium goeldii TaxID=2306975 RepID=A0A430FD40_9BIFI|nr:holo-ACP synthase [Bifidobacterium goeldii]RSX50784.1 4-phosphopantetheinyl transferase [Bifidobacterium goeldii]
MQTVFGLGHDVVDVPAFEQQLAQPGSRMRGLFSVREVRQAMGLAARKSDGEAVHLAAKWAGKEAVLKAWCEALGDNPAPYTIDVFPWAGIEILDDSLGRPRVVLRDDVERELCNSLPPSASPMVAPQWHISVSHDGGIASAIVVLVMS